MKKLALVLAIITLIFSFSGCSTTKYFRANYYQADLDTLVEIGSNIKDAHYRIITDDITLKVNHTEVYANGNVQMWEKSFTVTSQSLTGTLRQTMVRGAEIENIEYGYQTIDGQIIQTKTTEQETITKNVALRDRSAMLNLSTRLVGWYKKLIDGFEDLTVPIDCIGFDVMPLKLKIIVTRDLMSILEPDLAALECGGDVHLVFDEDYNLTAAMLRFEVKFDEKPSYITPIVVPTLRGVSIEAYLLPL